jgi:hypothetical protein
MSFEDRIESLRVKHQALDTQLKTLSQRPLPDPVVVGKIKREKLRLKDEISRLARA